MTASVLYWEDLRIGDAVELGEWRPSAEEIINFATAYDPQIFHVDPEAAKKTTLGGLAASGWHSCAMLMRLLYDALLSKSSFLGIPRIDTIRWQAPLRPNQTIVARARCLAKHAIADLPDLGACEFQIEAADRLGRAITRWRGHLVFSRRRRGGAAHEAPAMPWRTLLEPGRKSLTARSAGAHMLRFFDHVQPGDAIAAKSHAFNADDIAAFASDFDPCPPMLSENGRLDARLPRPDREAASIWHVAAAWTRCLTDYYHRESAWLRASGQAVPRLGPSPGVVHARWLRPVYAGDVITFQSWAERKLDLANRSGWGLLLAGAEGVNQDGETVVSFFPQLMLEHSRPMLGILAGQVSRS